MRQLSIGASTVLPIAPYLHNFAPVLRRLVMVAAKLVGNMALEV
jgi:hypothetical protein